MKSVRCVASLAAVLLLLGMVAPTSATLVIQDPGGLDPDPDPDGPVFNGFPATHSFTRGLPPRGDGEDWPRSLNPARQFPGGGASPGSFFASSGVVFSNLNSNPAYFDANNLLTRPATLINNEAFWTDPKIGSFTSNGITFDTAAFGFSFISGFTTGADFGFDLALASVSSDLPTGVFEDFTTGEFVSAPFLEFQIQDDNFNTARGQIVFAEGGIQSGDNPVIFAEQVGTFNTLNSPRTAYEGRFRVDEAFLRDIIAFENGLGFDPEGFDDGPGDAAGPIEFFDIELDSVATFGGTTQVAMDNFVLAGAPIVGDPLREPLTFQPLNPVGANRPQYFKTDDDSTAFDDILDAIVTDAIGLIPELGGLELNNPVDAGPLGDGSQTINTTIFVPSDSPQLVDDADGPLGGVSVEYGDPPASAPSGLLPEETTVGGVITTGTVTRDGVQQTGATIIETATRTNNAIGSIADRLAEQYQTNLQTALADAGVEASMFAGDDPLPLTEEQLGAVIDNAFGDTDLSDINDPTGPSSLFSKNGLLGSIDDGAERASAAIRRTIEGLDGGTPTTLDGLNDAADKVSGAVTDSVVELVVEGFDEQGQSIFGSSSLSGRIDEGAERANAVIRAVEIQNPVQRLVATQALLTDSQVYANYTIEEYLELVGSPNIGDSGGTIEAIYEDGRIVDFRFNSWIITDGNGSYVTSVALYGGSIIPEPTALLLMGLGVLASRSRRR